MVAADPGPRFDADRFLAALVINVPGAAYLIALKDIAAGGYGTAVQVVLVLGFNLVMFVLAEVPLVGLWVAPSARTSWSSA